MDATGIPGSTLLWIGGWASCPEAWRSPLEAAYPGCRHAFLPAEAVQDLPPEELTETVKSRMGDGGGAAVAWSLGSFLALRAWNAGLWPEGVPLLAACPVTEFCAPSGPWRRGHLDRMVRGLGRDREAVLEEFRALLWEAMPQPLALAWREAARGIGTAALVRGLEILREGRLDGIRPGTGLVLVEGARDRVAPRLGAGELDGIRHHLLEAGHVPFLEDARGFGQVLAGLRGGAAA
jgi:hypothetical protein